MDVITSSLGCSTRPHQLLHFSANALLYGRIEFKASYVVDAKRYSILLIDRDVLSHRRPNTRLGQVLTEDGIYERALSDAGDSGEHDVHDVGLFRWSSWMLLREQQVDGVLEVTQDIRHAIPLLESASRFTSEQTPVYH